MEGLAEIEQAPVAQAVLKAANEAPRHGVEMRAAGLPNVE
jgi:hypothetical protein